MAHNWRGLQPPALGRIRNPLRSSVAGPATRGVRGPVGGVRPGTGAIGRFEIGRRTKSRKVREVLG